MEKVEGEGKHGVFDGMGMLPFPGHDQRYIFGKAKVVTGVCRGRDEIVIASQVGEKEQSQVLVAMHSSWFGVRDQMET
ncbi:hypothetical protein MUK42_13248 [Musa troglodytarum]|uniref:Uncharacterized protein n=1 Tax=Musa troglodytarum TaxID=320322 RepID=A0A9E7HGI6_9LILI|nr:hypothetical protein MUK42_13248 [Musa troglodytarum]